MMTSQILKFVDSPKTQKFKFFENDTLLSIQRKKSFIKCHNIAKNSFLPEVIFKGATDCKLSVYDIDVNLFM